MSIKDIFNKRWIAIIASSIFFIFGVCTILGVLLWIPHEKTKFYIGFAVVGCLIGLVEILEGYKILSFYRRRYK